MSTKRRPAPAGLVNELRGASAFFQREESSATAVAVRPEPSPDPTRSDEEARRQSGRPSVRTPVRRSLRRHPFEFYQDQIDTLKRLSLEDQLAGGQGSMSAMVREAVDLYISNHTNTDRTSVRPDARTGGVEELTEAGVP